ncbi:MAG: hypothetical protein JKY56_11680 [Kofleriaceae bacterium]|nr:hypothetical protein [Kofleriaceae bacterium]
MPCDEHQNHNRNCRPCHTAALLLASSELGQADKSSARVLGVTVGRLVNGFGKCKGEVSQDENDLLRTICAGINARLLALNLKPVFAVNGGRIDLDQITAEHRLGYRNRLLDMGTWIGHTEFEVLSRIINIPFTIMVGGGANTVAQPIAIGGDSNPPAADRALFFTGDHYKVCHLQPNQGGGFDCDEFREAHPLGDCGLESVLNLVFSLKSEVWWDEQNPHRQAFRDIFMAYRGLYRARVRPNNGNPIVAADNPIYVECIRNLRTLLVEAMTDEEVNDGIIADGHMPEAVAEMDASWGEYVANNWVDKWADIRPVREQLGQVVECVDDTVTCVANIGSAQNWLRAVMRSDNWGRMRNVGLGNVTIPRKFGQKASYAHLGMMLARVTTSNAGTLFFFCAGANFAGSLVPPGRGEYHPWSLKNCSQDRSGKGLKGHPGDVHTEAFCMVSLHNWIESSGHDVTQIDMYWLLEMDMCGWQCRPCLAMFQSIYPVTSTDISKSLVKKGMDHYLPELF